MAHLKKSPHIVKTTTLNIHEYTSGRGPHAEKYVLVVDLDNTFYFETRIHVFSTKN